MIESTDIRDHAVKVAFIAALTWFAHHFQNLHLAFFDLDPRISLFYIPAGVISMSALVSPKAAPVGIFIGALIATRMYHPMPDFSADIPLVAIHSVAAFMAVVILYRLKSSLDDLFRDDRGLPDIDGIDVFYFCCIYGIINTSLYQILFWFNPHYAVIFSIVTTIGMWFGDLTGSFLVFVALNLGYTALRRLGLFKYYGRDIE
jgi:hypothetical protein